MALLLPPPPSWFPGHMARFSQILPGILARTDVVLELRDARLPLTSSNRKLEGALKQWREARSRLISSRVETAHHEPSPASPATPPRALGNSCEHVVVLNKRDLVPEWGIEPFQKAMSSRFPDSRVIFTSLRRAKDSKHLNKFLVDIAKKNYSTELNVLVVGMPNVGKSTLINSLRKVGISGRTIRYIQSMSNDPLVYAYDTPGVMLPFLGRGAVGAERGVKLALIAGIKEGLYRPVELADYLLHRLNTLNPTSPAYLLLTIFTEPMDNTDEFLEKLALGLGMVRAGRVTDLSRAASWFIRWWREEDKGLYSAEPSHATHKACWGLDFEWSVGGGDDEGSVQRHMEDCIDAYMAETEGEERAGSNVSVRQERKQEKGERRKRKVAR